MTSKIIHQIFGNKLYLLPKICVEMITQNQGSRPERNNQKIILQRSNLGAFFCSKPVRFFPKNNGFFKKHIGFKTAVLGEMLNLSCNAKIIGENFANKNISIIFVVY